MPAPAEFALGDRAAVAQAPPRWRKSERIALHWRDWGADSVCYDIQSGHTHQFSPLASAVMACFEQAPADVHALAQRLDLLPPDDNAADGQSDQVQAALQAVIAQFLELGWLSPTAR